MNLPARSLALLWYGCRFLYRGLFDIVNYLLLYRIGLVCRIILIEGKRLSATDHFLNIALNGYVFELYHPIVRSTIYDKVLIQRFDGGITLFLLLILFLDKHLTLFEQTFSRKDIHSGSL